ncbi:hypothetical protein Flavo103_39870 [Flavobacterium collinsii]|uniref:hypothetical protein n=1 Tax=Flavobacterium collinsii TaxID=1114861 RepID=UPI0022CA0278|nr:hypothetical protein [Flavobacterium collinsii]GIQ60851.1 hypothetical protein Flavo103_39870 [Flavobacterium collinsii]
MKKNLITALALAMFSCGNSNSEIGKLVTTKEYEDLNKIEENNGKRFSIVGYPFIDSDIKTSIKTTPYIKFYEQPNGKGVIIGHFPIEDGEGKNEFYTPETFTMQDVIFYDNEGNKIKSSEKLQISFTLKLQTERSKSGSGADAAYYGGPEDVRIDKVK